MLRVLVTGDRHYDRRKIMRVVLAGLRFLDFDITIIEGEAPGADTLAKEIGKELGYTIDPYPAHWRHTSKCEPDCKEVCGKPAGAIRNRKQLKEGDPDITLGFHDNIEESRGTKDMLTVSKKAGKPTFLISAF